MVTIYYSVLFVLSIIFAITYVFMWHKHLDTTFTMVFSLIPIACLGYVMYSMATEMNEAVLSLKLTYLGGSLLQYFIMLSIFNLCEIKIGKWIRTALFLCCIIQYASVLTIGYTSNFYTAMSFEIVDGNVVLNRSYGPMHTFFFAIVISFFVISIAAIIYSYFEKKQVSRRILYLIMLPDVVSMLSYFAGRRITRNIDFIPAAYIFAEFMYIIIAYRVSLYDINDTVIDSLVQDGDTGFITFDFKHRYLGSNETAKKIIPALNELPVDTVINKDNVTGRKMLHWLESFSENENNNEFIYTVREDGSSDSNISGNNYERIYNVNVNYLHDGIRKRGYMITLVDDTQNRRYIELLDNYNEELVSQVDEKTKNILEMHNNLIMSMAAMVESRDNSTGGHIKRTSVGVRILIDEINKDEKMRLSQEFSNNLIKAAPMHDLGKIAVDDAVLRKPGRFTEEEFEKMKQHAAEGARVIHEILKNTDDEAFKILAENVAHYHHERWDGSGYPKGLKGEDIPLEARIMAVADVYDALVSKRVYKDSMSFEQADAIIMEGMGTQFDPSLKKYYISARPRLEEYYGSIEC